MSQESKTMWLLSGIGILLVLIGIAIGFLSGALFNGSQIGHFGFLTSTSTASNTATSTALNSQATSSSDASDTSGFEPGLSSSTPPPMLSASDASTTEPEEYTDVADWQLAQETSAGFTMMYPNTFALDQGSQMLTSLWRMGSEDSGIEVLSITVPPSVEPSTNFVGATITAGYSQSSSAVSNCFAPPTLGHGLTTSSASVNGIKFVVYTVSNAGAGQQYITTSYRTTHAGACYAIEYTVHSTNLSNFPAADNYTEYNQAEINDILNRVVGTFTFL